MADPTENQPTPRKARPFGPFLLFLTVLVVVLVAFGSSRLASPTPVSQDELWWRLWNGSIASLEIRGDNEVLATNLVGERLVSSFTDAGAVEARAGTLPDYLRR